MKQKYIKPQMTTHFLAMPQFICTSFTTTGSPRDNVVLGSRSDANTNYWDEE